MSSPGNSDNEEVDDVGNATIDTKKSKKKKKKKSGTKSNASAFPFSGNRKFKVLEDARKGRMLIAQENIPSGTVLWREHPVSLVSKPSSDSFLCPICFQAKGTSRSSPICKINIFDQVFCSEACKQDAETKWAAEKALCTDIKTIAARHSCDIDLLRMILKLVQYEFDQITSCEGDQTNAIFLDDGNIFRSTLRGLFFLNSYMDSQPSQWVDSLHAAANDTAALLPNVISETISNFISSNIDIESYLRTLPKLPENTPVFTRHLVDLAAKVNMNAYAIMVRGDHIVSDGSNTLSNIRQASADFNANYILDENVLGFGLFPSAGMAINHSCAPNCGYRFFGGCIEYISLTEIIRGSEITVTYCDVLRDGFARRAFLKKNRYFDCHCIRCESFMKGLALESMDSQSPWTAKECKLIGLTCSSCEESGEGGVALLSNYCGSMEGSESVSINRTEVSSIDMATCLKCRQQVSFNDAFALLQSIRQKFEIMHSIVETHLKSPNSSGNTSFVLSQIDSFLSEFDPSKASQIQQRSKNNIINMRKKNSVRISVHNDHIYLILARLDLVRVQFSQSVADLDASSIASVIRSINDVCDVLQQPRLSSMSIQLHIKLINAFDGQGRSKVASKSTNTIQDIKKLRSDAEALLQSIKRL